MVRRVRAAGVNRHPMHILTGLSRATTDRILEPKEK